MVGKEITLPRNEEFFYILKGIKLLGVPIEKIVEQMTNSQVENFGEIIKGTWLGNADYWKTMLGESGVSELLKRPNILTSPENAKILDFLNKEMEIIEVPSSEN